jgi:DNA-binding NarL/FixJ family response regulator
MARSDAALPQALCCLVLEPSPLLRERLLWLALEHPGVAAATASTLEEALQHLRACRFDTLLVDVAPERWPALTDLLRLRAAAPDALLVALAPDDEPETVEACRAVGVDRVVSLAKDLSDLQALLGAPSGRGQTRGDRRGDPPRD